MNNRSELGEFLRARRAQVSPADVGLVSHGRRRVPGLRREELAQLAGVSVDYYVRVEQGRVQGVSESVLDALASALRLNDVERAHLHNLARPAKPVRRPAGQAGVERVRPGVQQLLDSLDTVPAYVIGRFGDTVAWNRLACLAFIDFEQLTPKERHWGRMMFLDGIPRERFADWNAKARETVGYLRLIAGRYPDAPELTSVIGELSVKSEEFRRLWADHTVREKTHGRKVLRNPLVGELTLDYESLALPDDQVIITYTAEPGSPTAEALQFLASWSATEVETQRQD
ncbi:helix-turn-helix transcriptional regulator [Flindersiella endophytica]